MRINHLELTKGKDIKWRKSIKNYDGFIPKKFMDYLEEKLILRRIKTPLRLYYKGKPILEMRFLRGFEEAEKELDYKILSRLTEDLASEEKESLKVEFSIAIDKYKNGKIYCLVIKHPNTPFDGNIVREIVSGRIKRMKGDLTRTRITKKKDDKGNLIRDENGNKILKKRIIKVEPYEEIPRFIHIED